jgi:prepilin-type N-terminal cleavage/methylation domain-containing protein/prepilin-type processing-associated H-X9-DG protein
VVGFIYSSLNREPREEEQAMKKTPKPAVGRRPAFTLVELLIVVVIIGMLIALLIPALGAAMALARNIQCQNNLSQLAKAALTYATDNKGEILPLRKGGLYWCNILAKRYITATNTIGYISTQACSEYSVLQCPEATDEMVTLATVSDPTSALVQGTYRLGNTTTQRNDCSYYWNGYSGGTLAYFQQFPSIDVDAAAGVSGAPTYHDLSELKYRAATAMVADGVLYQEGANLYPARIACRHPGENGRRGKTNIGFFDGHVEAMDRLPNPTWVQEAVSDVTPGLVPILNATKRTLPLEGGPPYFLLPKR